MRLIDADAMEIDLREQIEQVFGKAKQSVNPDDFYITRREAYNAAMIRAEYESFFEYLRTRPTIEAEPVKHGRWTRVDIAGEDPCECSYCGDRVGVWGYRLCPNCGARMDLEEGGK